MVSDEAGSLFPVVSADPVMQSGSAASKAQKVEFEISFRLWLCRGSRPHACWLPPPNATSSWDMGRNTGVSGHTTWPIVFLYL
jgi:hypothetical protein